MAAERTLPHARAALPVKTFRVEVVDGPDADQAPVATGDSLTVGSAKGNDLVLTDPTVSRFHLELSSHPAGVLAVDHSSTNGTIASGLRLERAVVPAGAQLKLGRTTLRIIDGEAAAVEIHEREELGGLYGRSPAMRRLMAQLQRASASDAAALIVGESGTGKELIAQALRDLGPRAKRPFVTVDCGALAPTLVASELFGHERGAFTGADRQHIGAFERAHTGTLFLDEVGELPPTLQSTLLGVLERRRFHRLGGSVEVTTDVRLISASSRDLRAEVNSGAFRLDLYYRLAVVVLRVPPLRERTDDVPLLVEHFLRECGHGGPVDELISPAAMKGLCAHHWPGNVRELRNLVEATVAMGEVAQLDGAAPAAPAEDDPVAGLLALPYKDARGKLLEQFEARYLKRLLETSKGNVSRAARDARMDRSHLIELLRRHQLK